MAVASAAVNNSAASGASSTFGDLSSTGQHDGDDLQRDLDQYDGLDTANDGGSGTTNEVSAICCRLKDRLSMASISPPYTLPSHAGSVRRGRRC